MLPSRHIIYGFLFSILIGLLFNFNIFQIALIFLSSFLIDFDHYLWYVSKKRDFNPIDSIKWFKKKREDWINLPIAKRKNYRGGIYLFHGIEFCTLIFFLGFFNNIFFFILIGILFHMTLDLLELLYLRKPLYPKLSIIYSLFVDRNKEQFFI
jgi:hypothetical protein